MCGIAGVVAAEEPESLRRAAVARMCEAMRHRGPDDDGEVSRGAATLGMRRLAIIDPAGGHQPMSSARGNQHIVFNGAIYNHRTLRAELETGGYPFRTKCDTEVLLAAYATWGAKCLHRLRGMFAFVVWDEDERSLFAARDHFGIKPLYFRHDVTRQRFLFASETRALLASGLVERRIDPRSVSDYLAWSSVPAPRTIYEGITSLRPGESLRLRDGRLETTTWWRFRLDDKPPLVCTSAAQFQGELRMRLEDSARAHRVADVPVGAFLSGGLDSSAITALAARAGSGPLKTFSITFDEPSYAEGSRARRAAAFLGTDHHETVLSGDQVARELDRTLAAMDQPTGDGINTYYASRAAHEGGVKVALSGLGGDELFGGYPSFRDVPRLRRLLAPWRIAPAGLRRALGRRIGRGSVRRKKLGDFVAYGGGIHGICALQRRWSSTGAQRVLLADDVWASLGDALPTHPSLRSLSKELEGADSFQTISAWETRTYMSDVLLRDSDVMSMAHSLELRVPFVDVRLVEWLWAQPSRLKRGTGAKPALAAALTGLLPDDIRAQTKRGFTLPFPIWMRGALRPFLEATFSASSVGRSGLLDVGATQALWSDYLAGDDERGWSRVWNVAVLIDFLNRRTAA